MNRFYQPWVAAGSHWTLAPIIGHVRAAILSQYPHAVIGTIGDKAHLTAATPEGHTPYDQTGWPLATPHGVVTALDVSNIAHLDALAMKLVNDARGGRIKWLRYLNFNGMQWSHWDGFQVPHANSDIGHVHMSARTDQLNANLAGYVLLPHVSSHYTVAPGDTLWSIAVAAKVRADGIRTPTEVLYDLNRATIEAAAKAHGHSTSNRGDLLYPGTVLTMP